MRKRFRAPPEKKGLSLARDRRPSYGESNKGARKTVPRKKRLANRQRRRADAKLRQIREKVACPEIVESKVRSQDLLSHKRRWRKCPDARLLAFIARQNARRAERGGRKARKADRLCGADETVF